MWSSQPRAACSITWSERTSRSKSSKSSFSTKRTACSTWDSRRSSIASSLRFLRTVRRFFSARRCRRKWKPWPESTCGNRSSFKSDAGPKPRARSRTRARRRHRDVRRDRHLAEQVQLQNEHPPHDPVRVAVAGQRPTHARVAARDRERKGGRLVPARRRVRGAWALTGSTRSFSKPDGATLTAGDAVSG